MALRLRVATEALVVLICLWDGAFSQADFTNEDMDITEAKCELCKAAVKILHKEIEQTDPLKTITVGSFRMKADGSSSQRKVQYRGSELHLQDLLDDNLVCGKMKDIVPVTDKETGALSMLNMVEDMDKLSGVKFFPNPDMNSRMNNLQIYRPGEPHPEEKRERQERDERQCQEMFGDHEEDLLEIFKKRQERTRTAFKLGHAFCHETIQYCPIAEKLESLRTPEDEVESPLDEEEAYESPSLNTYDPRDEL